MNNRVEQTLVRRFTDAGVKAFREWIFSGSSVAGDVPRWLLTDPSTSEAFEESIRVERFPFDSKFDLGIHIVTAAGTDGANRLLNDYKVWPWLSLFYSDVTMPFKGGNRFIGDASRHIIDRKVEWQNYDHSHRHLVRASVQSALYFGPSARVMLGKPHEHTKIEEQILSRKASTCLAYNEQLVNVLNTLYWDDRNLRVRKGAKSTGAGSIMRLVAVLRQLDVTHDLGSLKAPEITALLPHKEFGRWMERRQ